MASEPEMTAEEMQMNDSVTVSEQADSIFTDSIFTDPRRYLELDSWHRSAAWLRKHDPIHRVEADGFAPFYALTRHADIIEIGRQPDRFLNTMSPVLMPLALADLLRMDGGTLRTLIS